MINIYCFDPSLTKTKMYSWSPFCVTVRIYQTPVGRIEASRINQVSNEPKTKGAVKLLSVEEKKKRMATSIWRWITATWDGWRGSAVTKQDEISFKASRSFNDLNNTGLWLTTTERQRLSSTFNILSSKCITPIHSLGTSHCGATTVGTADCSCHLPPIAECFVCLNTSKRGIESEYKTFIDGWEQAQELF